MLAFGRTLIYVVEIEIETTRGCGTEGRPAEYRCEKKIACRSQQLQGRRIRSLAVMARKRRSLTHLS